MAHSILLIDDSAILRRIATNILGGPSLCFDVVTATRATEGFARACGAPPNLILVDAHLAGTAKAELCQRLLSEPRTAGVPVVLMLGRDAPPPHTASLPDNIVELLAKPFTPEQLLACVKTIHGASREGAGFAAIRERLRGGVKADVVLVDRHTASAAVSDVEQSPNRPGRGTKSEEASSNPREAPEARERAAEAASGREWVGTDSLRLAFQRIAAEKGSGVLALALSGRPFLDVYFEAGSIVVVTTEHVADYIRDAAQVLPSKVSPATLEMAAEEQQRNGVPFLLTLGARGVLSKAAAVDLLHQFGQRFFSHVWQKRPAAIRCEFAPLDALPGFALRLEPRRENAETWLLGTLRRLTSEDIAATAKHEGFVGTPSFLRHGQPALASFALTDREQEFARRVDGKLDLPGIAKAMGCTAECAYLHLHRFRMLAIMDYRPAPRAFVVTPRTSVRRVLPLRR